MVTSPRLSSWKRCCSFSRANGNFIFSISPCIQIKSIQMDSVVTYSRIASILLKQINLLRKNPQSIVSDLRERISKYEEVHKYYPNPLLNFAVHTKEGVYAVEDLITFIATQRECRALEWSYELHLAADCRAQALSQKGRREELELGVGDLVEQQARWRGEVSQLTFYGFIEPRELLSQMLIDDGHPLKNNRKELFNHQLNYVGIGVSEHEEYKFVVVFIFAVHVEPLRPKEIEKKEVLSTCGNDCAII